jgi:hypothetical protein
MLGGPLDFAGECDREAIATTSWSHRRATTPPQGEDKPSPLLWTSLARRFVGIVGAHPCGRPASVALFSRPFPFPLSFASRVPRGRPQEGPGRGGNYVNIALAINLLKGCVENRSCGISLSKDHVFGRCRVRAAFNSQTCFHSEQGLIELIAAGCRGCNK